MSPNLKPTLVLIPGLLCDERLWAKQTVALSSVADVYIPAITTEVSIDAMARAILASSPSTISLAGFSLGGQVALAFMELAPERVHRLALISTTHGGLLAPVELAIQNAVARLENGELEDYLQAVLPTYFTTAHANDRKIKAIFLDMARAVGSEAGVRQMRALLALKCPFPNLDRICCPVVIVGGEDDRRTTPDGHRLLASEIPGAALHLIPDSAHFIPLEQPLLLNHILQQWMADPPMHTRLGVHL